MNLLFIIDDLLLMMMNKRQFQIVIGWVREFSTFNFQFSTYMMMNKCQHKQSSVGSENFQFSTFNFQLI